jgi:hypothetical protein
MLLHADLNERGVSVAGEVVDTFAASSGGMQVSVITEPDQAFRRSERPRFLSDTRMGDLCPHRQREVRGRHLGMRLR